MTLRRYTIICCFIVLGLGLVSCLEKIDLKVPAGTEQALVVQGSIRKGRPSVIRVEISRLFDFTANTVKPVNVRSVEVEDDEGLIVTIPEVSLGVYELMVPDNFPDFSIEFGRSYRMLLEARDGRRFETSYESLHPVPEPSQLSASIIEVDIVNEIGEFDTREKLAVSINTPIAVDGEENKSHLKWNIERTFKVTDTPILSSDSSKVCYVTQNVVGTALKVLNGNDFFADEVMDYSLFESQISSFYAEGAYISVFQQSLSSGAFEYWEQITDLVVRSGNMFEAPAGKLVTNLVNVEDPDDEIYGYFYAFAEDTIRIYIEPEFLDSPRPLCPPVGGLVTQGGECAAPICCDCLDAENSTTQRPEFWIE